MNNNPLKIKYDSLLGKHRSSASSCLKTASFRGTVWYLFAVSEKKTFQFSTEETMPKREKSNSWGGQTEHMKIETSDFDVNLKRSKSRLITSNFTDLVEDWDIQVDLTSNLWDQISNCIDPKSAEVLQLTPFNLSKVLMSLESIHSVLL